MTNNALNAYCRNNTLSFAKRTNLLLKYFYNLKYNILDITETKL